MISLRDAKDACHSINSWSFITARDSSPHTTASEYHQCMSDLRQILRNVPITERNIVSIHQGYSTARGLIKNKANIYLGMQLVNCHNAASFLPFLLPRGSNVVQLGQPSSTWTTEYCSTESQASSMGAGQSTNAQASATYALHILRVTPGSPASQTSIEPFFDFIVGFNGKDSFSGDTDLDATELERIVEKHEDRVLDLLVWSGKTRETRGTSRTMQVIPMIELLYSDTHYSLARMGTRATGCCGPGRLRYCCAAVPTGTQHAHVRVRSRNGQRMARARGARREPRGKCGSRTIWRLDNWLVRWRSFG